MNLFQAFKTQRVLVKFYYNRLEMTDLISGKSISKKAVQPFSNSRTVLANYLNLEELMRSILKDLFPSNKFGKLSFVTQVCEKMEGGITEIEKRAIADSCQHAGARFVYFYNNCKPLSSKEALEIMEDKTKLMF